MTDNDKRAGLVREIDALLREDHGTTDATVLLRVARDQIVEDAEDDKWRAYGCGCLFSTDDVCARHYPRKAAERIVQLESALRWYANADNYTWQGAAMVPHGHPDYGKPDRGQLAQEALAAAARLREMQGLHEMLPAEFISTAPEEDAKKLQRLVWVRDGALQRDRARAVNASWNRKDAEFPTADRALLDEFERLSAALKEAQRQIALIPPDLLTAYRMALARAASCEQDAARWRWFCENDGLPDGWVFEQMHSDEQRDHIPKAEYDAAIDAALASAGQAKERE